MNREERIKRLKVIGEDAVKQMYPEAVKIDCLKTAFEKEIQEESSEQPKKNKNHIQVLTARN